MRLTRNTAMRARFSVLIARVLLVGAASGVPAQAQDWPEWRGPKRDGTSAETGLPSRWSPSGDGLAWRLPFGSRSAPVVLGNRLYVLTVGGKGATVHERLVCLDADTGTLVWEQAINVFLSDVPPHRVAWASPSVDPATGNIYVFGVGAHLIAFDASGKRLWEHSLIEEYGAITTHGGRTVSPVIDSDLVIVSTLTSGWGEQARGNNRYFAFDKTSGGPAWISSPQGPHYDTNYSTPVVGTIDGQRLLVVGGSDGIIHALKVATGESVWKYPMSKRAILTSALLDGGVAYVTQSEENLDTSVMGQFAAIDAGVKGSVTGEQLKWRSNGWQGGFSSPVMDRERLYEVDNGAVLGAFERATGRKLWEKVLGTIQKASPVLADGKLYVGTENGKFYILRPSATGVEVLDEDALGTEAAPEAIVASPAVARGRVYLASMDALYCIGPKKTLAAAKAAAPGAAAKDEASAAPGEPAVVQVRPAEVSLDVGARVQFRARLYDAKGRFVREEPTATWTLEQVKGTIDAAGSYVAASEGPGQAGLLKASVGALTGSARIRVVPALPWSFDLDQSAGTAPPTYWINGAGKFQVRDLEGGGRALVKLADNPFTKRARVFLGNSGASNYTVEADVRSTEKRRQMGDAGLIAQRYLLLLFGNNQRLELQAWQPNTARTVAVPFAWKPETWYRLKLRTENLPDGTTRVQGKAWPAADPEPAAWTVETVDTMPHRTGSPGFYADAPAEVFLDNIKVTANK